ncbi:hypothetical protein ACQ4WP_02230 [Janthinobacterium sp. GB4P2]|uniref:hypothetical protein n=1 Tax=Janthinobacterium sp. GB4P2 TaxID=3424189 RepID=UPI003F22D636
MTPFNTAKKIKSTEKVVIFIESSVARWAPLRVFSYEKGENASCQAAVVFYENVFTTSKWTRQHIIRHIFGGACRLTPFRPGSPAAIAPVYGNLSLKRFSEY